MVFTHEVPLTLPNATVHLDEWLFNLSEEEYQRCAKGHRGVGTSRGGAFLGMINVESIGGNLLVQHYTAELLEALHTRLYSPRSRAYLMHVLPFHVRVVWEMICTPISESESMLSCTLDVQIPLWARFLGIFIGSNHWIRKHLIEETNGFARDLVFKRGGAIERKLETTG